MSSRATLALVACALSGCFAAPSPLAPQFEGSVGYPSLGVQTQAVELPARGSGFVRYRPNSQHYFGVPRLVAGVQNAAAQVEQRLGGKVPLVIGDLSAARGGKIKGHASHRTGRDVDLLLYVTTPAGVPVPSPGFVKLGADGLGYVESTQTYVRFDVARQWELIKALLLDDSLGSQLMLLSQELEAQLIDYALARGEPAELIFRAQSLLLEPRDSLPHDDHLHLRVACLPIERVSGCDGGGPAWSWLPGTPENAELDAAFLQQLSEQDPLESDASSPEQLSGSSSTQGGA